MRVLFVIPPHPIRKTPVNDGMPLGVLYLASMIKNHCDILILDLFSFPGQDYPATLTEFKPDIVAVSIPFKLVEKEARKICETTRNNSNAVILLGGLHATLSERHLEKSIDYDFLIAGEAEWKFSYIMEFLEHSHDIPLVEFASCLNPDTAEIDINTLPFPSRSLLDNRDSYQERLITSRGCGFSCGFCSSRKFWGNFRGRNAESIVDELEQIYSERGNVPVSFADDSFTFNRNRVMSICDEIEKRGLKTHGLGFSSHPEKLDEEILDRMRIVGFDSFFLGVESGSEEVRKIAGKNYNNFELERILDYASKTGYDIHGSFMIGLPGESPSDIEKTMELADRLPLSSIGFHIFYPFKGCPIRDDPERYNIRIIEGEEHDGDIDGEAVVHNGVLSPMEILDYYYKARAIAKNRRARQPDD